jgi:PqqD family protein of HPr-rel-A system
MTPETLSVRLLQGADVTHQRVSDGALLLDALSGQCFALNRLGAEIWSLLDGSRTLEEVCATLEQRLNVSSQLLRADVERFVVDLERIRLVRRCP